MGWQRMKLSSAELRLDITLACGQSFRWRELSPGVWSSVLAGRVCFLSQTSTELLYRVLPNCHHKANTATHVPGKRTLTTALQLDKSAQSIKKFKSEHTFEGSQSQTTKCVLASQSESRIKKEVADHGNPHKALYSTTTDNLEAEQLIRDYFQLDVGLVDLYKHWCHQDPVLGQVAGAFSGVRILRQDPVENLFSFICSSNNNISRISSMVEKLCERYGPRLAKVEGRVYYGFPSLEDLAGEDVEEALRTLGFGYRAKYISATARHIRDQHSSDWLLGLREKPYEVARAELLKLHGVGPKVADCVCLMSLDKAEAIPVDTHVWQIAARDYMPQLKQCKSVTKAVYKSIGDFFRQLWGPYAGWAHSVMFSADLRKFQERKRSLATVPEVPPELSIVTAVNTLGQSATCTAKDEHKLSDDEKTQLVSTKASRGRPPKKQRKSQTKTSTPKCNVKLKQKTQVNC